MLKTSKYIILILALLIVLLKYNEVDTKLTNEDIVYTRKIMNVSEIITPFNYQDEISLIRRVQNNVLNISTEFKGIPHGEERNPKDLYLRGYGLCFDRSRTIEKMLKAYGFETRHISLFAVKSRIRLFSIFMDTPSHAITEVLTIKGWMLVDSNNAIIGLDKEMKPISVDKVQAIGFSIIENKLSHELIYDSNFIYLYGLYSRHGYFYSPYNFVPDINLEEFCANLF